MTAAQNLQERYTELLKGYVAGQGEEFLLQASELGREMVLAGLPAENVAELHAVALHAVVDVQPPVAATVAEFASAPLAELLMAYGLASRAQVSNLESAHIFLEASEQRFRDFADASSDWMWETGPDLRYSFVTDSVKQTIGRAPGDYLGKARWEMSHPGEDADKWSSHMKDLEARRPFHDFTYTVLDADGRERVIRESGKPAIDEEETFLGYRGTGRDITSLVEARERTARIRQQLGDSLENISEGYCLFDAAGKLIICNSHYRQCYPLIADLLVPGAGFEEILRAAAERGGFPEAKGRVDEWVNERLIRHRGGPGVVECRLSDGRWYRVSEHATREGGIVKVLTDVTELKAREQALAEAQAQLVEAIESISEGFMLFDKDDRLVLCNSRLADMYPTIADLLVPGTPLETLVRVSFEKGQYAETEGQTAEEFVKKRMEKRRNPTGPFEQRLRDGRCLLISEQRSKSGNIVSIRTDITELKRAEQALKKSEERFRHFAEEASDWLWEMGPDLRYAYLSPSYEQYSGIPPEDVVGCDRSELYAGPSSHFDAKEIEEWTKFNRLAEEHKVIRGFEQKWIRPDGEVRYFLTSAGPVFDADGNFAGYRGVGTDITERKRAEQAVRESEQRVRGVLENVVHGIVTIDERGRIESFNPGAEKMFGYAAQEVLGENVGILMPEPERGRHDGYIENYLRTGQSGILGVGPREVTGLGKDGREIPIQLGISEMRLGGRRVFVGALVDLTERKKAERQNALLAAIVNHLPDAVEVCGPDLRIRYVNPAHEKTTGYAASEVLGRTPAGLFRRPEADPKQYDEIVSTISGGDVWTGEFGALRKDGSAWNVEAEIFPVHDEGGAISRYVAIKRDITERRRVEHQLQQAQKMDAVGQLTGGVAHDFNNLLTVILGNLQLIERRAGNDERLRKRVTAATHAAQRGAELTGRLLAFSRRQVLETEVVDLNQLVSGMDDLFRRTLGEAIEIETVLAADLWPTEVDPAQMETSLLNLAVNARDAMEASGRLIIETANATLDEAYAASHDEVEVGDYVMVAVTDTGTGMPAEVAKQVFEPFFTTKEVGKGTGLGLSMIYGFVKQSGGTINIYSEEGHGTTFRLYFPKSASADAPAARQASGAGEIPGGSETVLVVEDDAGVREVTVAMMKELGYRVLEAGNGVDALAVLDEHGDIDLLFSDVVMPGGMSGPALGKLVHKRSPEIKILYTSGYTHSAFSRDGNLDPDVSLLSKPFQREELAREVRRVLDDEKDQSEK